MSYSILHIDIVDGAGNQLRDSGIDLYGQEKLKAIKVPLPNCVYVVLGPVGNSYKIGVSSGAVSTFGYLDIPIGGNDHRFTL